VMDLAMVGSERGGLAVACADVSGRLQLTGADENAAVNEARKHLEYQHNGPITCLRRLDDWSLLVGGADGSIVLRSGSGTHRDLRRPLALSAVHFLKRLEMDWVASGHANGRVLVFDLRHRDGTHRDLFPTGETAVTALKAWRTASAQWLVSGHADGSLVWHRGDAGTREWLAPLLFAAGHRGAVTSLAADGELMASAAADGVVLLWRLSADRPSRPLAAFVSFGIVTALCWLPAQQRQRRLTVGLHSGELLEIELCDPRGELAASVQQIPTSPGDKPS
jgi:WD40 repeat protein